MKFIFAIVFIAIVQNSYAQEDSCGVCPKPKYKPLTGKRSGKDVSEKVEAVIESKTTLFVKYGKEAFENNFNILKQIPGKCVVAYGCKNLGKNKKSEVVFVLGKKADSDVSECIKALVAIGFEPKRLYKNDLSNCKNL